MGIDLLRLQGCFEKLKCIGKTDSGGITRLSYSPEFRQAQAFIRACMEMAGMKVSLDSVGNIVGTYAGRNPRPAAVASGSHLDTVRNGGAFDGALGILAAIECIRSWHEQNWRPLRSVKVIAFIEEEGARFGRVCFGSRAIFDEFAGEDPANIIDGNGHSLKELLNGMGLTENPFSGAMKSALSPACCFVELHIEQGCVLEKNGYDAGVVTAIVGIKRMNIKITGKANHSGTTSMDCRQDALVAAATLISYIYHQAVAAKGRYVATVGKLGIQPNEENVVPGEVSLTIEIRSETAAILEIVKQEIEEKINQILETFNVQAEIIEEGLVPPVPMNDKLTQTILTAGERLGIHCKKLPSWAGHDSMIFAQHLPTGMIFVPSVRGISHSPEESSEWKSIEKAVQILEEVLRNLASTSSEKM